MADNNTTEFTVADFSYVKTIAGERYYELQKPCVIFTKVFDKKLLEITIPEKNGIDDFLSTVNEHIKWLGSNGLKNELVKRFGRNKDFFDFGAGRYKTEDTDEWYNEIETLSAEILIREDKRAFSYIVFSIDELVDGCYHVEINADRIIQSMWWDDETVTEQGLAETEAFFNSEAFENLCHEIDETRRYSSCLEKNEAHIKEDYQDIRESSLDDEEIAKLIKKCEGKFYADYLPQGYLAFLKKINGFEFKYRNGFIFQWFYGFDDCGDQFGGFDYPFDYDGDVLRLFAVGEEHIYNADKMEQWHYCYDRFDEEYVSYNNTTKEKRATYGSFAEVFITAIIKAYGRESDVYSVISEYVDLHFPGLKEDK